MHRIQVAYNTAGQLLVDSRSTSASHYHYLVGDCLHTGKHCVVKANQSATVEYRSANVHLKSRLTDLYRCADQLKESEYFSK